MREPSSCICRRDTKRGRLGGTGEVICEVVDHGPGLSEGELERIFAPFEQGRVPSRGSGLGLAIAHGFAQANGARLEAEPGREGGASFALSLPAST